ncbi:hypothetical protein BSKO_11575 [Bryopsis sp. KO-2023]|nr:hypothetical protein BSKO_11575 [Bryopsis sp. KO-2023]
MSLLFAVAFAFVARPAVASTRGHPSAANQPEITAYRDSDPGVSTQRCGNADGERGWHDTGIRLADGEDADDETEAGNEAEGSTTTKRKKGKKERIAERRAREKRIVKKGKKVDVFTSVVPDPDTIPANDSVDAKALMSNWRMDKLKDLTYTQFWALVREGHVEKVKYTSDHRSVVVDLKESAPGGARQVKVGLPYDPDLFDHLVANQVYIEDPQIHPLGNVVFTLIRLAIPISVAFFLVQFSYRIGEKKGSSDQIFGGANLDMMEARSIRISFKDIAGVDEIKGEIKEIVQFLKNPKKFLDLGARSPGGILLVGPPGTGKTLLAKAIAGEAEVKFFSTAGTEFMEMYVGVGASRVRDMFEKARKAAPCILFIDEFDGIGKQRSYSAGNDESVHTINQLLTEMDGFEDNTGVVVIAATNRPGALDQALTRPGRFDRIVHLPHPNLKGREEILQVHARDKLVAEDVDYNRISRATAGFTGAELMNLMNQSAIVAVRQARVEITEMDVFEALEGIQMERQNRSSGTQNYDQDIIPPMMRRAIAIYEAGRALVGYITPYYDEVHKVTVCPNGVPTGNTFFIPQEERLESRVVTRSFLESKLAVCMAGRCAERLLLGDNYISTAGAPDLEQANIIAREMIYRCGFSKKLGPVSLMDSEEYFLAEKHKSKPVAAISTELARMAFKECRELLESAEAKAYYGLAMNYEVLEKLVERLLARDSISGKEVEDIFNEHGSLKFPDPFIVGFGWDDHGELLYREEPTKKKLRRQEQEKTPVLVGAPEGDDSKPLEALSWWDPANPYHMRWDLPELLSKDFKNIF